MCIMGLHWTLWLDRNKTIAVKSDLSGITGNGQYIQDIWGRIRDEPFLLIIQDVPAKTGSWQPYLHNNGQREVQVLFN